MGGGGGKGEAPAGSHSGEGWTGRVGRARGGRQRGGRRGRVAGGRGSRRTPHHRATWKVPVGPMQGTVRSGRLHVDRPRRGAPLRDASCASHLCDGPGRGGVVAADEAGRGAGRWRRRLAGRRGGAPHGLCAGAAASAAVNRVGGRGRGDVAPSRGARPSCPSRGCYDGRTLLPLAAEPLPLSPPPPPTVVAAATCARRPWPWGGTPPARHARSPRR